MPNERAIQLDPVDPSATGQPEPTGTYPINATCSNCDWKGEAQMPKGVACEKGKPTDRVACPQCGCRTLVRDRPAPEPNQAVEQQRQFEDILRRQEEARRQAEEQARRGVPLPYRPQQVPALPPNRRDQPFWRPGDYVLGDEQAYLDHTVRPSTTDGTQGDGVWMNGVNTRGLSNIARGQQLATQFGVTVNTTQEAEQLAQLDDVCRERGIETGEFLQRFIQQQEEEQQRPRPQTGMAVAPTTYKPSDDAVMAMMRPSSQA